MDNFDLRKYLAEGKLFEEDNTTYALHITTVEYDNGKPGYTYEVVDLDTEEEVGSKFGFKPLYFVGSGDEGDQQVFKGQDFNSIKTYGMYQDKVVNKEESLEIYKGLINGEDFYEKFSFDPRDLAEGKLLKEQTVAIDLSWEGFQEKFPQVKDDNLAGEVYDIMQDQGSFDDMDDEDVIEFMNAASTWTDAEDVADYFDEPASDIGKLIAGYYQTESGYEDYDDKWYNYLDYLFPQTEREGDDIDDYYID